MLYLENLLYISAAIIAVAFLILVIYLSKTLNSLQITLNSVSKTLDGLEKQLDGVTRETTDLLHKTNALADDIQKKSESLNSVVDAVKEVGGSVQKFNQSLQNITTAVDRQLNENKDKISQIVQWSNVLLELKEKWKTRKEQKHLESENQETTRVVRERGY